MNIVKLKNNKIMKEALFGCLVALFFIALLAIFGGWIFMLLWNWLVPMFWTTAPILNIWQSVGILFLLNIVGKLFFGSKK